jgi:formiminotetrahydrofolate cyclodeaminase
VPDSLLDLPVREFLDAGAGRTPTPGGGSVAAVTTAIAAALTAMAARYSDLPAEEAFSLQVRAAGLADADAAAFAAYRATLAVPDTDAGRPAALERAADAAAAVPAEVAECAARIAELARELVRTGNPHLRSDATAALALAAASATSAAGLVAVNEPESPRRRRAAELAASARALAAVSEEA